MNYKDIMNAYLKIRKIDNTIPDEVLDFMKDAAIEKLQHTLFPINQTVSGQSPNNQNSENNKSEDADNLAVNRGNIFTEQVDYQIKNSNDN